MVLTVSDTHAAEDADKELETAARGAELPNRIRAILELVEHTPDRIG